jgi:hypothetical protein
MPWTRRACDAAWRPRRDRRAPSACSWATARRVAERYLLLFDALKAGHAGDAAPRAAHRPRRVRTASWSDALGVCARREGRECAGHARAGEPAALASPPGGFGRETVDVGSWLRAPAGETLHEGPLVRCFIDLR